MEIGKSSSITQYVKSVVEGVRNRIRTFYSREDFQFQLAELEDARKNRTSEFADCQRLLSDMFRARNILNYEEILDQGFNASGLREQAKINEILNQIPTREELIVQMVQELYHMYTQFPTAQDYMRNIVKNLSGPSSDSLRLQILKQFVLTTNYHTEYVVNVVEKKFTSDENQKYNSRNDLEKRQMILEKLDDSIFDQEPFLKFSDWQDFFSHWISLGNGENEKCFYSKVHFDNKNNITDLEKLERAFYEYLNNNYNFVEEGKIKGNFGEVYESNKISFIKANVPFFDFFNSEEVIGWDLKAYVLWLIDSWNLKNNNALLEFARNIEIIGKNEKVNTSVLREKVSSKETIKNSAPRRKILQKVENEVIKSCINTEIFNQKKAEFLLENYKEKIDSELKKRFLGLAGLSQKLYQQFLTEQIELLNIKPLEISNKVRDNIKKFFPEIAHLCTDTEIILGLAHVKNLNLLENEGEKIVDEICRSVKSYLKQIKRLRNGKSECVGIVFGQALKDKYKTLPYLDTTLINMSNDLAETKFSYGGKTSLYLFAFAFDMEFGGQDSHRDVVNLFNKVYCATSFKNFVENNAVSDCEGINLKNYVEVSYLWWLQQKKLPVERRLDRANQFIDNVFRTACQLYHTPGNQILSRPNPTSFYKNNIIDIFNMNEQQLENFLLANYYIYSPDRTKNNNRIMIAPLMNTAKKIFRELASAIRNEFMPHTFSPYKQKEDKQNKASNNNNNNDIFANEREVLAKDEEVTFADCGISVDYLWKLCAKEDFVKDEKFKKLLQKLNDTLQVGKRGLLDDATIQEMEEFIRMDLIALYHFYFIQKRRLFEFVTENFIDWEGVYYDFVGDLEKNNNPRRLNDYLVDCCFQPFSEKNLFDQFIFVALMTECLI